jgi:prolycopene isomerase
MFLEREATSILFEEGKPVGVRLDNESILKAKDIIYSGTVWNLYGKMLDPSATTGEKRKWAKSQIPTYPSVVLYAVVEAAVIPADTAPIEMLIGNPDQLDESEVTAYILSMDDKTLCNDDEHTVLAIGPTFDKWELASPLYQEKKQSEQKRLIAVLEKRFPGFGQAVRHAEVATPGPSSAIP